MARNIKKKRSDALYQAIAALKDEDECRKFFEDLCTPTELRSMEQRYDVAVYLLQDQVYAEPAARPSAVSAATFSTMKTAEPCGT